MNSKKQIEIDIVEKLYIRDRFFGHDINSEQPDFIMKDLKYDTEFGIEITQIYKNEATARFKNISTYLFEIMQGKYRNKKDIKVLEKDTFTLEDPIEGVSFTFNGVRINSPSIDQYCQIIKKSIIIKNQKFSKYKALPYINLIIYDKENTFGYIANSDIQNILIDDGLKRVIVSSPFNEIFIISDVSKGCAIYPIKLATITTIIFKAKAYCIKKRIMQSDIQYKYIYSALFNQGVNNMHSIEVNEKKGLIVNNYMFSNFENLTVNQLKERIEYCECIRPDLITNDEKYEMDEFIKRLKLCRGPIQILI